jgi:SAM-dependent methyltransferase
LTRRKVLYAGSGGHHLPPEIFGGCEEVRLDIDPGTGPDIVASILDLGEIGPFDAIYTCHTLEHIYPHHLPIALREFRRVLADDGFVLSFVPNLEGLTLSDEVIYESPAGPVTAIDMFYGFRPDLIANTDTMAHHNGFTGPLLKEAFLEAGFRNVTAKADGSFKWNLMVIAQK